MTAHETSQQEVGRESKGRTLEYREGDPPPPFQQGYEAAEARIVAWLRERAEGLFATANAMRLRGEDARADKREVAGIAVLAAADAINPVDE